MRMNKILGGLAVVLLLALTVRLGADSLTLTDGTVIEGEVKKIGSVYQVTLPDGRLQIIPESRVAEVAGQPAGAAGGADAGPRTGLGSDFQQLRDRMTRINEPVRAVALWEAFLARGNISQSERTEAEKQLKHWQGLYNEGAELVRGRWIGGDDLKSMRDEADKLVEEGIRLENSAGGAIAAVRKYQEAVRIYPNSFLAHFRLGYIYIKQGQEAGGNPMFRRARVSLNQAMQLGGERPAVLTNYGACMFFLREFETGIQHMWRAAQKAETQEIVGNLLFALDQLPRNVLMANPRIREINLQANFLRDKGMRANSTLLYLQDPNHGLDQVTDGGGSDRGPPGLMGNGSGFFITPDGYLLTNKHVAETDQNRYFRVRLADKDDEGNFVEYNTRFIAADSRFDVALLKVDLPEGKTVPYLRILERDFPSVAAQAMVLGYPATGTRDMVMQVVVGTVRSNNPGDDHEVWFDLATTHGNSGGPIVDRNGDVIAIITAGRTVYNVTYLLGVGPRQIREFFDRIGDKSPDLSAVDYDSRDQPFDSEKLAAQVSPATLLVLMFRGSLEDAGSDTGAEGETPAAGDRGGSAGEAEAAPDFSAPVHPWAPRIPGAHPMRRAA